MTDVSTIKSSIIKKGGIALGCQYMFTMIAPEIMRNKVKFLLTEGPESLSQYNASNFASWIAQQSRHVSLMAESVSIPGRQLMTSEYRIAGTVRKMPYGVLYDDLTVTFICTNSMAERTFFDVWQQLIVSPAVQYMEFYDNYVGTIVIQKVSNIVASSFVYDQKGNPIPLKNDKGEVISDQFQQITSDKTHDNTATYVLQEAYPVSIQAQELSYSDGDYLKLTVQFAYSKWKATLDFSSPKDLGYSMAYDKDGNKTFPDFVDTPPPPPPEKKGFLQE
jgi:hypothetical protein